MKTYQYKLIRFTSDKMIRRACSPLIHWVCWAETPSRLLFGGQGPLVSLEIWGRNLTATAVRRLTPTESTEPGGEDFSSTSLRRLNAFGLGLCNGFLPGKQTFKGNSGSDFQSSARHKNIDYGKSYFLTHKLLEEHELVKALASSYWLNHCE